MGKDRVAVVGIGQTKHSATRGDVSMAGLVREAAQRALDDAHMTWQDIDAVVIGKAPDFFEGLMMPELYLAEALGCVGLRCESKDDVDAVIEKFMVGIDVTP